MGLRIQGTYRVSIIPQKNSAAVTGCPENPFISLGETTQTKTLGKPPKRQPWPSGRTPIDRAKVIFDDLTLFFLASKKDIKLYPVRQTIKKLALVVVWVVFPKLSFGWFPQGK